MSNYMNLYIKSPSKPQKFNTLCLYECSDKKSYPFVQINKFDAFKVFVLTLGTLFLIYSTRMNHLEQVVQQMNKSLSDEYASKLTC